MNVHKKSQEFPANPRLTTYHNKPTILHTHYPADTVEFVQLEEASTGHLWSRAGHNKNTRSIQNHKILTLCQITKTMRSVTCAGQRDFSPKTMHVSNFIIFSFVLIGYDRVTVVRNRNVSETDKLVPKSQVSFLFLT
jgi:hypothetical protein